MVFHPPGSSWLPNALTLYQKREVVKNTLWCQADLIPGAATDQFHGLTQLNFFLYVFVSSVIIWGQDAPMSTILPFVGSQGVRPLLALPAALVVGVINSGSPSPFLGRGLLTGLRKAIGKHLTGFVVLTAQAGTLSYLP